MNTPTNNNHHGYILDASPIPAGFIQFLQDRGYVAEASRTVEGAYVEPQTSLAHVLDLFERAGSKVHSFRAAGTQATWQESNTHRGFKVLSNPRSSAWLPTVPAV